MGQQQLLLLVLGIIIVGLAVVVGISAFSENRIKASADALVSDGLRIASDVQAWAIKPVQVGGGGGTADALSSLAMSGGFQTLGYPVSGEEPGSSFTYSNPNGSFYLFTSSMCSSSPVIPSGKDPVLYVTAIDIQVQEGPGGPGGPQPGSASPDVVVCVGIAGTNADDIGTTVQYGFGEGPGPGV